jgi:hypothetical protein
MTNEQFINWLANELSEKRSDISELCQKQLKGDNNFTSKDIEHRYIQARIPNTDIEIEYDTLTTELSYHKPLEQWEQCVNHNYLD